MTAQHSKIHDLLWPLAKPVAEVTDGIFKQSVDEVLSAPPFLFYTDNVLQVSRYANGLYTVNDNTVGTLYSARNEGGKLRLVRAILPIRDSDTATAFMQESQARLDAMIRNRRLKFFQD